MLTVYYTYAILKLDISSIDITIKGGADMFGYKIEIWKYDVENYKKAEKHILEMAEKGYELVAINDYWIPLAIYRKTEDTKNRKYCAVPVPWYDTDYEMRMMCEDAGWYMLAKQRTGVGVFYSDNPDAAQIFTDEESEAMMGQEVTVKKNGLAGCFIVFMILMMLPITWFVFFIPSGNIYLIIGRVMCVGLWLIIALEIFVALMEERLYNGWLQEGHTDGIYEKPEWLYKLYYVRLFGAAIMAVVIAVIRLGSFVTEGGIAGIIMAVSVPVMFTAGIVLKFLKNKDGIGQMLIAAALAIAFFGDRLFEL